jgi:hypothetical protein
MDGHLSPNVCRAWLAATSAGESASKFVQASSRSAVQAAAEVGSALLTSTVSHHGCDAKNATVDALITRQLRSWIACGSHPEEGFVHIARLERPVA